MSTNETKEQLLQELESLRAQLATLDRSEVERKKAEAAMHEAHDYLATLSALPDLMFVVDKDGRYIDYRAPNEALLFVPPEQFMGKTVEEVLPPDAAALIMSGIREAIETGQHTGTAYQLDTSAGPGWFELSISTIGSPSTPDGRLVMLVRDITERQQAEAALQHNASRLETLREIDRAILAAQSPEGLAQAALSRIRKLFSIQRASITLFDMEAETASILTANDVTDTDLHTGARMPLSAFGDIGELREGRRFVVPDMTAIEDPSPTVRRLIAEGIRSYVNVPLIAEGELIGSLNLGDNTLGAFQPEHIDTAESVADSLAIAIRQAGLKDVVQRRAAELEAVRQVSLSVTSSLALKDVLGAILGSTFALLDEIEDTHIFLYEEGRVSFGAARWADNRRAQPFAVPREDGLTYKVAREGMPTVVPHIREHPMFENAPPEWDGAIVGLPLKIGDRVVGVMNIAYTQPREFEEAELRVLGLLADQAAIAIENARLFGQAQRRTVELEALHELMLNITAELDLDALLRVLVENALGLLGAKAGGIYLYRPEREVLEWIMPVGPGQPPPGVLIKRGEGASGKVWKSGEPLIVDDYSAWDGRAAAYEDYAWGAAVCVPIRWADEFLGVICATTDKPNAFSERDVRLLSPFAAQAAVAIKNARLFNATHRRQQYLATLRRVSRRSGPERNPQKFMQAVVDALVQEFDYSIASILLGDDEAQVLTLGAVAGPFTNLLKVGRGYTQPYEVGILGWVMRHDEPRMALDTSEDLDYISTAKGLRLGSELVVPIRQHGKVIGVLNVEREEEHSFDEFDLEAMSELADELATRLENVVLYEQAGRHAEELEGRVAERTAELEAASEHLKTLSQLKDQFVANVSHELRTPIASQKLYHDLLRRKPEKTDEYLHTLRRETNRLERIVEDMLQLSRMDQAQLQPRLSPVNINQLVAQYVADRPLLAESQGLTLRLEAQPDLPTVKADDGLLGQALSILLTNALNYTPPGGEVVVSTRMREDGDRQWIGFIVSDNGPGISPEEQERLFERFFRGKAARASNTPGTGLGLAIVKEIVDRHQGSVEVHSTGVAGEGATFSVWVPVEDR